MAINIRCGDQQIRRIIKNLSNVETNFDIDKMYRATEAAKLMRGDKCSVTSSGEDSKKLISYISRSVFITQIWKERKKTKKHEPP